MDAAGSWGSGIASTETESTCLWLGKATTTTATSQQRASGQESALSSATQNSLTVRQQIGLVCNFRKAKILAPGPTWWLLLWAPYQINRIWTWWSQQDLYVEISHLEIIRDFLAIQLESCSKSQIKNLSVPCQLQFFAFQKKKAWNTIFSMALWLTLQKTFLTTTNSFVTNLDMKFKSLLAQIIQEKVATQKYRGLQAKTWED